MDFDLPLGLWQRPLDTLQCQLDPSNTCVLLGNNSRIVEVFKDGHSLLLRVEVRDRPKRADSKYVPLEAGP